MVVVECFVELVWSVLCGGVECFVWWCGGFVWWCGVFCVVVWGVFCGGGGVFCVVVWGVFWWFPLIPFSHTPIYQPNSHPTPFHNHNFSTTNHCIYPPFYPTNTPPPPHTYLLNNSSHHPSSNHPSISFPSIHPFIPFQPIRPFLSHPPIFSPSIHSSLSHSSIHHLPIHPSPPHPSIPPPPSDSPQGVRSWNWCTRPLLRMCLALWLPSGERSIFRNYFY